MKILNDTLSDLKVYARKKYDLNHNVNVILMLISEKEYDIIRECYAFVVKQLSDNNAVTRDLGKERKSFHYLEEFFPHAALTVELIHKAKPKTPSIITPILRTCFAIPNFAKYKYAIMIRVDKLLEWGKKVNITAAGVEATEKKRKIVLFYKILTHEFLHVIEREKGIRIYTDNSSIDSEIEQQAFEEVKQFYSPRINDAFF